MYCYRILIKTMQTISFLLVFSIIYFMFRALVIHIFVYIMKKYNMYHTSMQNFDFFELIIDKNWYLRSKMLWFNFDIYTAITLLPVIKKKKTIKIAFWGKFMIELHDLLHVACKSRSIYILCNKRDWNRTTISPNRFYAYMTFSSEYIRSTSLFMQKNNTKEKNFDNTK